MVIAGGGAGGLELAVRLAGQPGIGVFLVDQSPTHIWKPRLHEMAAGARRGMVDEMEYAGLAERWGFVFVQGSLRDIAPDARRIELDAMEDGEGHRVVGERELEYDVLVLAIGGVTPDLGVDGVTEHAFMLDRAEDAEALFSRLSLAALDATVGECRDAMDTVIVGTGLTGVELAAYLATDAQPAALAPRDARPRLRVTLVEAVDEFMPSMGETERRAVRERLEDVGVTIRTGCQISRVAADHVETDEGTRLDSRLTVWATGRVGPPIVDEIDALQANDKRQWRVRKTLQSVDRRDIFALGDCAAVEGSEAPPTAQAASEQANHLARELPRYCAGQAPRAFEYRHKGTLMSLGAAGAVGRLRSGLGHDLQIRGRVAAAAYRGLERQHEMVVLGRVRGSARMFKELFSPQRGPRVKVH
ncbi:FAD-dependent pyridine nucleotide-disulfide oxidoreductase [Salinisphaera hydrothermalis C41B8]|uniref:FAD-dependent pyridine nucleotide-disulfide oxidoreductase n=1 Tax=Salinisphaera hydrothermalis (strain C41B8) TaxID=1304275 RepID=A0A084IRN8_SALHC|nr:FAD-dependent pyridine nucleotide-disulfide oxidoreductase [Salinisphaera hydrothermalis C41B8]